MYLSYCRNEQKERDEKDEYKSKEDPISEQRARIRFQWRGEEETLRVGVLPHLEEDIIIGTDYAAFPRLLSKAGEEHMMKKWWKEVPYDTEIAETRPIKPPLSKQQKRAQRQQNWEGNRGNTDTPGITGKVYTVVGDFRQKQREDPSLKNAWAKALSSEEEGAGPTFHIHNNLLYRAPQSGDMDRRQLLVPGSYREQVLQLAHGDTGEGHLRRDKTEEVVLQRFYWPGLLLAEQVVWGNRRRCHGEVPRKRRDPATGGDFRGQEEALGRGNAEERREDASEDKGE
ncbi:hypothetical protein NDU88_005127 [Pleurodeles waltl]|uniref:Gypsy retrotransposon integrase-like protein 1 n=1 Tax=Pleurodeles waltl TaxID=8319 RepID=A0AAV7UIY3_PLEWA|nr:hypothetical protein NDU88_005127 [Pleurodeles waltl]